jgi:hypothetical protein
MTNLAEALGQDVLDQAVEEFDGRKREGPALLGGERDPFLAGLLDPGVGDMESRLGGEMSGKPTATPRPW